MTHRLGRLVPRNTVVAPGGPVAVPIDPAPTGGPPLFVMLHFNGAIPAGDRVEVPLGYDTDVFTDAHGVDYWSRPFDPTLGVHATYFGAGGSVRVVEYGSGEPTQTPAYGSFTNPDVFLRGNPYQEPTYETRGQCQPPFAWKNAALAQTAGERRAVAATGIIVMIDDEYASTLGMDISSCSGTLIEPDLFLTARHCATMPNRADINSGSVCFDFQTDATGHRPPGYAPRWYKVIGEVAVGSAPTGQTPPLQQDWLILRLDTGAGGIPVTPATVRTSPALAGESVIAVHHPNGAVKKMQRSVLPAQDQPDRVKTSGVDLAGGSSGSALFDDAGQVIGASADYAVHCNGGYCPATTMNDALTSVPPGPASDVVIALDHSGSMSQVDSASGLTKLAEAEETVSLFAHLVKLGAGHRLGLVEFNHAASVTQGLLAINGAGDPQTVVNAAATLQPGGNTSIGRGLQVGEGVLAANPNGNRRTILLMTDGLENTQPWIRDVAVTDNVIAVGYGDESQLDSALLTKLAREHRGWFHRAKHGLGLRKFFTLAFGNIFASGMAADPDFELASGARRGAIVPCDVAEETEITVVVSWHDPAGALTARVQAPNGAVFDETSPALEVSRGRTWWFARIALPADGAREGRWEVAVERAKVRGTEPVRLTYFVSVVADGGPRLIPYPPSHTINVGDPLPVLVGLRYDDGTVPRGEVEVTITRPLASLEQLVKSQGLVAPPPGLDAPSAWAATLIAIAAANGGELPIPTAEEKVTLYDDAMHEDGAMEPDGIYGAVAEKLTEFDGVYTFHARGRYGTTVTGTREAIWSVAVGLEDPDPYSTVADPNYRERDDKAV